MKTNLWCVIVCSLILCACGKENLLEKAYNQGINIIPMPVQLEQGKGYFTLESETGLTVSDDSLQSVASFFAGKIQKSTGFCLKTDKGNKSNAVNLIIDKSVASAEGYKWMLLQIKSRYEHLLCKDCFTG